MLSIIRNLWLLPVACIVLSIHTHLADYHVLYRYVIDIMWYRYGLPAAKRSLLGLPNKGIGFLFLKSIVQFIDLLLLSLSAYIENKITRNGKTNFINLRTFSNNGTSTICRAYSEGIQVVNCREDSSLPPRPHSGKSIQSHMLHTHIQIQLTLLLLLRRWRWQFKLVKVQ